MFISDRVFIMSIGRIGNMLLPFNDKRKFTLTNRSTGVTVDVIQGHAEWMVKICNSPMLTVNSCKKI
jgi:hypothetical protein